jgi:hypothetical protein
MFTRGQWLVVIVGCAAVAGRSRRRCEPTTRTAMRSAVTAAWDVAGGGGPEPRADLAVHWQSAPQVKHRVELLKPGVRDEYGIGVRGGVEDSEHTVGEVATFWKKQQGVVAVHSFSEDADRRGDVASGAGFGRDEPARQSIDEHVDHRIELKRILEHDPRLALIHRDEFVDEQKRVAGSRMAAEHEQRPLRGRESPEESAVRVVPRPQA